MKLYVVSPEGETTEEVDWVEVDTPVGNFVIHGGHAPTILTLLPDHEITYKPKKGAEATLKVDSGIVEVTRDRVMIVSNG